MDLKTDRVKNVTTDNCSEEQSQEIDMENVDIERGDNITETGHHSESMPVDESNFLGNDFEALANIQEELDRLTAEQVDPQEITHAVISEDGTAVPLTINPETGQYMTHDGQHIVLSENSSSHVVDILNKNNASHPVNKSTSDLSSLAAAAERHEVIGITMEEVMDVDNSSIMSNHPTVTVGSDGHHIVLGGSHNPATIPKVENHPRKIQPQVKLASKDLAITSGSSSFRIAPSNMQGGAGTLRLLNNDGTISDISTLGNQNIRVLNPDMSNLGNQNVRVLNSDMSNLRNQNIRVLNSDGTFSPLPDSIGQNIRFVTSEGSMLQLSPQPQQVQAQQVQQPQQVRIMNPDGTITIGSPLTLRSSINPPLNQTPQIRILSSEEAQQFRVLNNSNDSTSLSPGSFRVISSGNAMNQQKFDGGKSRVRIVNSNPKSPVKAITLSQAQQMGLLSGGSSQGTLKILPKSPLNIQSPQKFAMGSTIRTADGKTIIIGSPQKQQQIIIGPSNSVTGPKDNVTQQIIRIPSSKVLTSSEAGIHQIQAGSKVQYVRVISTQSSSSPHTQMLTVKSGTPILPSTLKTGNTIPVAVKQILSSNNMVKLALPSQQQQQQHQLIRTSSSGHVIKPQRIILPSPVTSSTPSTEPIIQQTKIVPFSESKPANRVTEIPQKQLEDTDGEEISESEDSPDGKRSQQFLPIVTNNHAYEAFLKQKEDKPKLTSSSGGGGASTFEPSGVRPRKPCNCTKSQCLKLYCDCFANGEFCFNCNCTNCNNNLHHERQRQKSIKQCLDRNPSAFRPKIGRAITDGERRHNKGCNCKRSGCLKNYCECYEAKIPCNDSCKCIGCKNLEEDLDLEPPPTKKEGIAIIAATSTTTTTTPVATIPSSITSVTAAAITAAQVRKTQSLKARLAPFSGNSAFKPIEGVKQPFSFVTNEVVEATCQCLLAQAEEAERKGVAELESEGMVIEEFGRCLKQIIEIAKKTNAGNTPGPES